MGNMTLSAEKFGHEESDGYICPGFFNQKSLIQIFLSPIQQQLYRVLLFSHMQFTILVGDLKRRFPKKLATNCFC